MSKWAASMTARKVTIEGRDVTIDTRHSVGIFEASSKHEAFGKAMQVCLNFYPMSDGYSHHRVVTQGLDEGPVIDDPADAVRIPC